MTILIHLLLALTSPTHEAQIKERDLTEQEVKDFLLSGSIKTIDASGRSSNSEYFSKDGVSVSYQQNSLPIYTRYSINRNMVCLEKKFCRTLLRIKSRFYWKFLYYNPNFLLLVESHPIGSKK